MRSGWPPRAGGDGAMTAKPCRLTVHMRPACSVPPTCEARPAGGPGRIRTGFFRVRGGCPAVGRQAQMGAGEGIAPPCLAYEARLDLSPANPQWLQRQDSNLHVAAYEAGLGPFQARCNAGGVAGSRTPIIAMPRRRRAIGPRPHGRRSCVDGNQLPVGDTDGPEGQSLRTPGLEASGRGAPLRQNGGEGRARTVGPRVANAVLFR